MKILIVIDKQGTAIDRLARSVQRNLPQHQIIILPVHPKRSDEATLFKAQELMNWADLIDIHYWRSGQVLRMTFPKEFNAKPKLLFHFNPYDARDAENKYYGTVVVGNKEILGLVPDAHLIPYGVDLDFFKFNEDYTDSKRVMMSVARIERKKGVREVAQVCKDLGYTFTLVGRISKPEYVEDILSLGEGIEFWENVDDEQLRQVYKQSAVHVCNSIDDFESGTLPILEAMAMGVPVLTRSIGHVPDLYNGKNMVVRDGQKGDLEDLKTELSQLMEDRELRNSIREEARETVKSRDDKKMAEEANKLYESINPIK